MTKKKVIRKFWRIKRLFSGKVGFFPEIFRKFDLGFSWFFLLPNLGFSIFLSGNTGTGRFYLELAVSIWFEV